MERGSSSNQSPNISSTRRSNSDTLVIRDVGNTRNNVVNQHNINNNTVPYRRHPDLLVPIANIIRIMRRVLPPHVKISEDAKKTIQECISEYVSFITGEANDRCYREHRKTVTAEDILYAHSTLGFDNYVRPLTLFLNRYRLNETNQSTMHGDPSVRRTTYFPEVQIQDTPFLIPRLPSFPSSQVANQQGWFTPTLTNMNDYYNPSAPTSDSAGNGGSRSASNPAFDAHQYGFYSRGHGQFK